MDNYRRNETHELVAIILVTVFILLGLFSAGSLLVTQVLWWAL